jgi:hypothetical protein
MTALRCHGRAAGSREPSASKDSRNHLSGRANVARRMLRFLVMKHLKKLIVVTSLIAMISGCYVEGRGPRYARRDCAYGWYWDGYRCHRYHR